MRTKKFITLSYSAKIQVLRNMWTSTILDEFYDCLDTFQQGDRQSIQANIIRETELEAQRRFHDETEITDTCTVDDIVDYY